MKHRAMHIIVLLLLGAFVNIAVAWGCVYVPWSRYDGSRFLAELRLLKPSGIAPSIADSEFAWLVARMPNLSDTPKDRIRKSRSGEFGLDRETFWDEGKVLNGLWLHRTSAGIPFLSVCSWNDAHNVSCGVEIKRTALMPWGQASHTALLPLLPIWPGFAINTIFYAAILWALFFVPGMVKRTLRRKRGLCPACAYPIGTSPVCTECGNIVPRHAF